VAIQLLHFLFLLGCFPPADCKRKFQFVPSVDFRLQCDLKRVLWQTPYAVNHSILARALHPCMSSKIQFFGVGLPRIYQTCVGPRTAKANDTVIFQNRKRLKIWGNEVLLSNLVQFKHTLQLLSKFWSIVIDNLFAVAMRLFFNWCLSRLNSFYSETWPYVCHAHRPLRWRDWRPQAIYCRCFIANQISICLHVTKKRERPYPISETIAIAQASDKVEPLSQRYQSLLLSFARDLTTRSLRRCAEYPSSTVR